MGTLKFNTSMMEDMLGQVGPFTVGFDRVFNNLQTVSELANNYPPYNIIKHDDENYTIEIAAAGFRKDEFNINIIPEGNKLVVQGVQDRGEDDSPEYTYQGIAARNFTRTFALAEDVEVGDAEFVDGLLLVHFTRVVPEAKKPRTIEIS